MASQVTVDGVEYEPVRPVSNAVSIGIGITTRNRWETLTMTLAAIRQHTPGARIIVVDDASDEPAPEELGVEVYRFEENVGIARAKNKCLELLDSHEHIFLFDDDAYPKAPEWWKPYVESPEPHLMRIFADLAGAQKLNDIKVIYQDDVHVAYTGPRGVMLYVHRSVLDVVGGMDVVYGKWGYEHGDWSNRIHNAGLTTWRFADVVGGGRLIHSMDEHQQIDRSVDTAQRRELVKANVKLYYERWDSREYREYREMSNVVLTCFFTGTPDPQRPNRAKIKVTELDVLRHSLLNENLIVFSDGEITTEGWAPTHSVEVVKRGVQNLYIQRWVSYRKWLLAHPSVEYVWMVDGTDVELLNDPWSLTPEWLYVGHEPQKVETSAWLRQNTSPKMLTFLRQHGRSLILNAGLVGGDRATVLEFLHEMIKLYFDNQTLTFLGKDKDVTDGVNDMSLLNIILRQPKWELRLRYGPEINTEFKKNERNAYSTWRHK